MLQPIFEPQPDGRSHSFALRMAGLENRWFSNQVLGLERAVSLATTPLELNHGR